MDDFTETPISPRQSDRRLIRTAINSLLLILILAGIGTGIYWFTRPAPESTAVLGTEAEITPSPTPQPTAVPSPTLKPSSTPKPTTTPKPTSVPSATPASKTITVTSNSGIDGFRANNNGGNSTIEIRAGNGNMVGAPAYELVSRGFVSFSVPSEVAGKIIDQATLRLYQYQVSGTPYASGNKLIIDHLDYGSELASDDYDRSPISSNIGALTDSPVVEWKDFSVTSAISSDVTAGHSRSQFRLRFSTETDSDSSEDVAYFYSNNSGSNTYPPQLVIKYH